MERDLNTKLYSETQNIDAWILAIFFAEDSVCSSIASFISIPNISVLLMILLIILVVITHGFVDEFSARNIMFSLIIFLALLFSIYLNGFQYVQKYLLYFLVFCTSALMISSLKVNFSLVIDKLICLYVISLLSYFLSGHSRLINSTTYWVDQMSVAYCNVPMVMIVFIFLLYRKQLFYEISNFKVIIAYVELVLGLYIILFHCATRGAIISIILTVGILLVMSANTTKKVIFIIGSIILSIIIITCFDNIVQWIINTFSTSSILALRKLSEMLTKENIDNGRNSYYLDAFAYFKQSPIWGNGIGYFEKYHKGSHPHQIFLQILCEYGIIGFALFVNLLFTFFRRWLKMSIGTEKLFAVYLFGITFLILLYSSSYWILPISWYFLFYMQNFQGESD